MENGRKYVPRRGHPTNDEDYYRERVIPFKIYQSRDDYSKDEEGISKGAPKKEGINRERVIMSSPSRHAYIYAHGRAKPYPNFEAGTFLLPKVALLEIKPPSAQRHHQSSTVLRQKRQVPYGGMVAQPAQVSPTTNNDFVKFPFSLPEPFRSFFRTPPAENHPADPFNVDFTRPFASPDNSALEDEVGEDATEAVQSRSRPGHQRNLQRVHPQQQAPSTRNAVTPGERIRENPFYPPLPTLRPIRNQIPQYHRPPFQQTEFNNFEELYPYLQKNFPFPPRGFGETTTPLPQAGILSKDSESPSSGVDPAISQDEKMVTLNIMHGPTQSPMVRPPSFETPPQVTMQNEPQSNRPRRPGRRRRPTKEPSTEENVLPKNTEPEPLIPLRDIPLPQYTSDPFDRFFVHDPFSDFRPPPFNEEPEKKDDSIETQTESRKPFRNQATTAANPIQATVAPARRATRPPRPTRPTQRSRARDTAPPAAPPRSRSREERVEPTISESHENDALNGLPFGARIRSNGRKVDQPTPKPRRQEPPVRQTVARALPEPSPRHSERLIQSEPPQPFAQNLRQSPRGRNQVRRPMESEVSLEQPHQGVTMPGFSHPPTSPQRRAPSRNSERTTLRNVGEPSTQQEGSSRAPFIRGSTQRLVTSRQNSRYRPSSDEIEILPQAPSVNEERTRRAHRRPTFRDRATTQSIPSEESKEQMTIEKESFRSSSRRNNRFQNSNVSPSSEISQTSQSAGQTPRQSRRGQNRGRPQTLDKQGEGKKENKENSQGSQPPRANRKRFRKPRPQMILTTTESLLGLEPTTPLFLSHVEYVEEDPDFPQKSIQILQENPVNLSALPFHDTTTTTEALPTTTSPGRVFTARAGGSLFHRRPRPGRPRQPPKEE